MARIKIKIESKNIFCNCSYSCNLSHSCYSCSSLCSCQINDLICKKWSL